MLRGGPRRLCLAKIRPADRGAAAATAWIIRGPRRPVDRSLAAQADIDAMMRVALPHAAALRLGEPAAPLRPKTSDDFTVEVAAGARDGLAKLRGYVPAAAAPLAPAPDEEEEKRKEQRRLRAEAEGKDEPTEEEPEIPPECALVRPWLEGGRLTRRLSQTRRVAERDLHRWASQLAAALAACHRGGSVFGGPTPDVVALSKRGPWPDDEAHRKKEIDKCSRRADR